MICYPDSTDWRGKDADVAPADKALAEAFAWESLRTLMGGSLSICAIDIRPHRASCAPSTYYIAPAGVPGLLDPYIGVDGEWRNWAGHRPGCDCGDTRRIQLPGPVGRIDWVMIDGAVIDPLSYQVVDNTWLVRLDGKGWPVNQNMFALPDEPNTFVVRYYRGAAPDELDNFAAGVLAREFVKSIVDPSKCRLPKNTTGVSRQGVSYDIDTSGFSDGRSGIPEVDAIVSRRNPHLLKSPAVVLSIDTIRRESGRITSGPGIISMTSPVDPAGGTKLVEVAGKPGYYTLQDVA